MRYRNLDASALCLGVLVPLRAILTLRRVADGAGLPLAIVFPQTNPIDQTRSRELTRRIFDG